MRTITITGTTHSNETITIFGGDGIQYIWQAMDIVTKELRVSGDRYKTFDIQLMERKGGSNWYADIIIAVHNNNRLSLN